MTETQQHQEPIKAAERHAESVITDALQATDMLEYAQHQADPKLILSARERLKQAQHETSEAQEHLDQVNSGHKYDAQLEQITGRLQQAEEELEIAIERAHMPKQIR